MEGVNPLSHAKTDVWRLTHLHDAGRLDHLSVSSTHSYMMKTNRGMFPGQRRKMEFSWFARKKNLPRRVWRLPSVCTTVSSLGRILTWYWTLSVEEHQSQQHSLVKNNHPAAVSPVFNWWRIHQYYISTLFKLHLFSRVSKCHKKCLKLCSVLPIY